MLRQSDGNQDGNDQSPFSFSFFFLSGEGGGGGATTRRNTKQVWSHHFVETENADFAPIYQASTGCPLWPWGPGDQGGWLLH